MCSTGGHAKHAAPRCIDRSHKMDAGNSRIPKEKDILRAKIRDDMDRFLKQGGTIRKLENHESALDPSDSSFIMRRMRGAGKDWGE